MPLKSGIPPKKDYWVPDAKVNPISYMPKIPVNSAFQSAFDRLMEEALRRVHTQIPAKVVKVNKNSVKVQPLITTLTDFGNVKVGIEDLMNVPLPVVDEVPVYQNSAGRGESGLFTPVKEGDVGVLLFSERNTNIYLNTEGEEISYSGSFEGLSSGSELFPLAFLPEIYTDQKDKILPTDRVILKHKTGSVEIIDGNTINIIQKGDGPILIKSEGSVRIESGTSSISLSNGELSIERTNGRVRINGGSVTQDGDFVTSDGISLRDFKQQYDAHIHKLNGSPTTPPE